MIGAATAELAIFFRDKNAKIDGPSVNWDSLIQQASAELLLPALNRQISDSRLSRTALPPEIGDLLLIAESLNAERNRAILTEAVHATRLLNNLGIRPVALKGLAFLLNSTYPDLASRYLFDIDLLIPATQVSKAVAYLYQNGYAKCEFDPFMQFRHHHPGIRRLGYAHIELHHRVGIGVCNRLLPSSRILANAIPFAIDGAVFLVPSATDLVNHLILHSQLHHPYNERIFPPLRALVDLAQIQARFSEQIDWEELVRTYRMNGEYATLALHLHDAHKILGLRIPPPIPENLPFPLRLRYLRRQFLNRFANARFFDPAYILMSAFSRRLRLVPDILRQPGSWQAVLHHFGRPAFYRKLIG